MHTIHIQYPITGPLREPLLWMEWVVVFIYFELGLLFLIRYKTAPKEMRNYEERGYFSIFLSYSLMWVWFIIGDYYVSNSQSRFLMLNLGYLTQMLGAFYFIYTMEKNKQFIRKYFFLSIFSFILIVFIILFIFDMRLTQPLTYLFWPIFFIFFFLYLKDLAKKQVKLKYILAILKFFIAFSLLIIGFLLTTDWAIQTFGFQVRFYGNCIQLLAAALIYLFFSTLPPLSEFDWYGKINTLVLMNNSGIRLYSKRFQEKEGQMSEDLIAGAMTSIHVLLEKLTTGKGITVIKKEKLVTIIYPCEFTIGVIICIEDLNSLKLLLKRFVNKFEKIYKNILIDFKGDVSVFKPVETICNDIFSSK